MGIQEIEQAFAALEQQVSETEGAEASALNLIQGLRVENVTQRDEIQLLRDQLAAGTPVTQEQLDALLTRSNAFINRLDASEQTLASAVVANP